MIRKIDLFVNGEALIETKLTFPFIDVSADFDPFIALVFIRLLSVVVSIISGVYYFKIYELIAPSSSNAEITSKSVKPVVTIMHDQSSVILTIVLIRVLLSWFMFVQ